MVTGFRVGRAPVFPPTLASTMASSVVGTWIKGTPRMYVAATKPARSPTTPPPSAIIQVFRGHLRAQREVGVCWG